MDDELLNIKRRLAEAEQEISRLRHEVYEPEEEDEDYYFFDEEDYKEQQYERLAERAYSCKCGAWQFNSKGDVVHVADCCCGAE